MNQALKLKVNGKSRNGNTKKKYIVFLQFPFVLDKNQIDDMSDNLQNFEKGERSILLINIPAAAKFKVISF